MAGSDWQPPPETFADRLARLRRAKGVSNKEIADAAGVSAKTVSHWIGGQEPEAKAALRLADFFGVPLRWLLLGEEEPSPEPVRSGSRVRGAAKA